MRQKKIFLILALLCAVVQGAWAQASWDEVYAMTNTTEANWTALTEGSTTGKTIGTAGATTYLHVTGNLTFSNSTLGGSGLTILGTVYLYVPQGVTITCTGANADGQTGAGAGIELAAGNALCLLGKGAVSATGGNAADGGDGLKGGDAGWDSSNYWSGTGGNGGYGGGGAGAGIGTRGGDGGAGGAGAANVISKWSKWDHLDGGSGFAGQAGATAGAMGEVYKTNSFGSLTATGGAAGSSGSAGGAGKSMLYDGTGYNYTTAGGGGGGAGGFGGAASNIGTGGPGGGGGGGGASGILDWTPEPGYDVVRAPGGKGGQNANGTWAAAGAESIMNHNAIKTGQVKINTSGWEDDKYNYDRYVSEQAVGTGGSGGARGSASTSESTITLNMKIPTQEEWDMVCQQTKTSQSQWWALLPGGRKGVTIGIAGTTTYYFATGDCSFTGVNAGSSGLTIKGTVYIYVPQGMTITCTGTHASGTTGAGAGIELSAGNVLYLLGKGAVNATGGNAANGGNGANGRDASCDWEEIRWAWVGGDGHGGYGGGGAGAGIGTRGGDGGAGGSAPASEIYYKTWVENGVAGSAGGAGLTADAMGSLYVTESFGSLTATGGAAGSKSGSAGSAGKSCLHICADARNGVTSLPGGGGGGAGGFGGAASNIGTGGPGGGGGGGGAKGSHSWTKTDGFYKISAFGGGGGQNADGSFAADGGTAGVSKANIENGLCSTNKKDWVKDAEERIDFDVPPVTIGGSGGAAGAVSLALWPTQGMGEENSPYLISNEYEWNTFANNVSLGRDYSGQYVKLANDISVMQKCGTVSGTKLTNAFSGTFDGDGHTITAAITDTDNQGTALFCYINGATIKNLKVAGAITGGMHAAAIVGTSEGTGNVIEGCVATANVTGGIYIGGTYVGGRHIGGILGHGTTSDIAISGCVFSGMMTGSGEPKGALFGWGDNGGAKSVTDCLYMMADGQNTTNLDLVRQWDGTVSVTNCYKTTSVGTYGTQCIFTTSAPSQLGTLVHDYGVVKAYENGLHYNGKYYLSPAASTNAGTEGDPYIISSTYEWDSFAQWIDGHRDGFTGEYVQLAADITVSMPAGTSEAPFGGTFLGNGHTITANITDTSNGGTALFRYINGATIKDLTVAGSITGGIHAAAIVGFAQGTGNSIRNCVATANVSGGTHIGGILGHGTTSDIAISGCVFSGTMTGGAAAKGVFFGWGDNGGTKSVTDCLYLMANGQNTGGLDLVRMNKGTVSVTNCYKTNNAGSNGKYTYAYTTAPANLGDLVQDYGMLKAYENGILYNGTYYVAPATLTLADNADNSTIINTADGYVADVTLTGRTLYKDGAWNTLCLPFDATKTGLLAKAVIKELDTETAYDGHKTGFEDGTLYLNFKDAESIVAGKPYIVKWTDLSQEHIINPSGEVFAALDFITEVPTFDGGQETNWESTEGPEKLVDGKASTKYGLGNFNPRVDFHYTQAITPKGYALMTAEDTKTYGSRNPKSWTIKARNSGDASWTTLTTVDNTNNDKLPIENNQWTVFKLDNSTAYQYFRFEATKNSDFQLAELRFCTMEPGRTEYENPTFEGVTLQADAPTAVTSEDGKVSFTGTYSSMEFGETDNSILLMGGENMLYYPTTGAGLGAQHAYFKIGGNGAKARRITGFSIDFGDSEATGIISAEANSSHSGWYTIDGRRLNGKPTRSGVYINNGVKVVIK